MTKLEEILAYKQIELEKRKLALPIASVERTAEMSSPPLDFSAALRRRVGRTALIAECKRASPSRGMLAENLDPLGLARVYCENGVAAVSVLTDERFFKGSLDDLQLIARARIGIPLLRKDFIFDEYQVYEARAVGADAVLLIVAALSKSKLCSLRGLVRKLGMAALVEIHDRKEIETALSCDAEIIGINNRNLHDFSVRLETSLELCRYAPAETCVVAESGIRTPEDVSRLADAGIKAVLVGEALVTAEDIPAKVRSLV